MIDNFLKQPGRLRTLIYILVGLFFALLIFQAGMYAGYRKAAFSYGMGAAYYNVFEGQPGGNFPRGGFVEAHGAAGKIISIHLPTFVLEGPDNLEKVILIDDDTEIRRFRAVASSSDLAAGDFVIVIGEPNDEAEVTAKLIRILPPPPAQTNQ